MEGDGEGNEHRRRTVSPPWSDLPPEILSKILDWLPAGDRPRFRAVCRSWNSSPPATLRPMPWLLLPYAGDTYLHFYSPWEDRTFAIPLLKDGTVLMRPKGSSPDGTWLVYLDNKCEFHAVHLLTGEQIHPPSITKFARITGVRRESFTGRIMGYDVNYDTTMHRFGSPEAIPVISDHFITSAMVFFTRVSSPTSLPTESSSSPEKTRATRFMFVFSFRYEDGCSLVFAREGDASWTHIDLRGVTDLHCLQLHYGRLYAIDRYGKVVRVDGLTGMDPTPPHLAVKGTPASDSLDLYNQYAHCLAVVRGRLWMITTSLQGGGGGFFGRSGGMSRKRRARFLQLRSTQNGGWVDKSSLNGYAIFAGGGCPLVCSTRELKFPQLVREGVYLENGNHYAPRDAQRRMEDPLFPSLRKYRSLIGEPTTDYWVMPHVV